MNSTDSQQNNEKLGALFDLISAEYEANRFFPISARQLAAFVAPEGEGRLLDVATGTGLVALHLAKEHPGLHITGIDLSSGMLQQAKGKARADNLGERTDFLQMDAMNLMFPENHFDFVTCSYGIFFLPDMIAGVHEFMRVLKPGGQLVFSSFRENAFDPFRAMFVGLAEKYGAEVPRQSWMNLATIERIDQFMRDTGVFDYTIEQRNIRYEIAPEDWWHTVMSTGYRAILAQILERKRPEFKQVHLRELKALAEQQTLVMNADSFYISVQN